VAVRWLNGGRVAASSGHARAQPVDATLSLALRPRSALAAAVRPRLQPDPGASRRPWTRCRRTPSPHRLGHRRGGRRAAPGAVAAGLADRASRLAPGHRCQPRLRPSLAGAGEQRWHRDPGQSRCRCRRAPAPMARMAPALPRSHRPPPRPPRREFDLSLRGVGAQLHAQPRRRQRASSVAGRTVVARRSEHRARADPGAGARRHAGRRQPALRRPRRARLHHGAARSPAWPAARDLRIAPGPVGDTDRTRALGDAARRSLWQKARSRPHYFIGFLEFLPDALPAEEAELPLAAPEFPAGPWGAALARCRSAVGQSWLRAAEQALERIYARAEYADENDPLRPPPRTATLNPALLHD